jgi:mono/diheme cytochrome c family protein
MAPNMRNAASVRRSRFATTAFVVVALVASAVCGVTSGYAASARPRTFAHNSDLPDTAAITPAMVELGRAIFHGKGTCFACHGASLEGTQIAPTLKSHAWRDAKKGAYAAIFGVITTGVPGTVMVAQPGGISKSEALSVASYVWEVGQQKTKP